jgi:hypothetical protein
LRNSLNTNNTVPALSSKNSVPINPNQKEVISVSDQDPPWIRIRLASWIQIQEVQKSAKTEGKKEQKERKFIIKG